MPQKGSGKESLDSYSNMEGLTGIMNSKSKLLYVI